MRFEARAARARPDCDQAGRSRPRSQDDGQEQLAVAVLVEQHRDLVGVVALDGALAPALADHPRAHGEGHVGGRRRAAGERGRCRSCRTGRGSPGRSRTAGTTAGSPRARRSGASSPAGSARSRPPAPLLPRRRQRRRDRHRPAPGGVAVRLPRRRAEVGQPGERGDVLPPAGPASRPAASAAAACRHRRAGDARARSSTAPSRSPRSGKAAAPRRPAVPARPARTPGSTRPAMGGGSACSTQRTSGLSIPMPNATVAAMTRAEPSRNAAIASRALAGGQPGVVQGHPLARRRERVARRLRAGVGGRVDDPRAAAAPRAARDQLALLLVGGAHVAHRQRMCGRSKSPITATGSRRPSRRTISCRTGARRSRSARAGPARRARRPGAPSRM